MALKVSGGQNVPDFLVDFKRELEYRVTSKMLSPLKLGPNVPPTCIELFTQRHAPMRALPGFGASVKLLQSIGADLNDAIEMTESELTAQLNQVDADAKQIETSNNKRVDQEQQSATNLVAGRITEIQSDFVREQKTSVSPIGRIDATIRNFIDGLEITDLRQHRGEDCHQFAQCSLHEFQETIASEVRSQLAQNVYRLNAQLQELTSSVSSALRMSTGEKPPTDVHSLEVSRAWEHCRALIRIGKQEEIRIKRLGALGILGKTRQKVFMVLMLSMLLPKLGLDRFIQIPTGLMVDAFASGPSPRQNSVTSIQLSTVATLFPRT